MKSIRPLPLMATVLASLVLPLHSQTAPSAQPPAPGSLLLFGQPAPSTLSLETGAEAASADAPRSKTAATFVQPPDPSTIPAPLPLPPEPANNALDMLPGFSPLPTGADLPEFTIRRRENPSLVPDGPNPTEAAALALNQRYHFQNARARALLDPEVQEALALAQKAPTDRSLRDAMRLHYKLLFAKMRRLDSSLESLIAEREKEALAPLQERFPRTDAAPAKAGAHQEIRK